MRCFLKRYFNFIMSLVKVLTKYTITELLKVGEKKVRLRKNWRSQCGSAAIILSSRISSISVGEITDQAVRFSIYYEKQFAVVFFFLTRIFLPKNSSIFFGYFYSIRFWSEPSLFWRQWRRLALLLNKIINFTRHQKHVYSVVNVFFFQKYLKAEPFYPGLYIKKKRN